MAVVGGSMSTVCYNASVFDIGIPHTWTRREDGGQSCLGLSPHVSLEGDAQKGLPKGMGGMGLGLGMGSSIRSPVQALARAVRPASLFVILGISQPLSVGMSSILIM